MNNSTKGFSLIEVLLVMGAMFFLLTAAFVIFPMVTKQREANEQSQLATVAKAPTKRPLETQSDSIETSKTSSCKKNEENCIREYGE